MIKIEDSEVFGWEAAIRGMRNPMNSWDKSDSWLNNYCDECVIDKNDLSFTTDKDPCNHCEVVNGRGNIIGPNDLKLMKSLSKAGPDHGKFLRMINVTCDITAPLYWYKEYDTYKVGTVANSCSTMHKISDKEFTLDDFSYEHLFPVSIDHLCCTIDELNYFRDIYINGGQIDWEGNTYRIVEPKDKDIWWQMIQLLPSSYNQKRTVQLNYQVLKSMYFARRNHKLDEWRNFCAWCETLPYFKEICIQEGDSNE